MIEPLLAHFLAGAVTHSLLNKVTRLVGAQRIDPDKYSVLVLCPELWLTVDGPREVPVIGTIFDGYNTAGCDLTFSWISLADANNLLDNLFVFCLDGSAHPVGCLKVTTEIIGIAVLTMLGLSGDILPQIPGLSYAISDVTDVRSSILITIARGIGAAAIGDKHQIVFG